MNLIELDRALRQLRLGGMAAVLETHFASGTSRSHGPHRLDCMSGFRPNSLYAPTVYSNAAVNRPPFAMPTGLSITSTSPSIRK